MLMQSGGQTSGVIDICGIEFTDPYKLETNIPDLLKRIGLW